VNRFLAPLLPRSTFGRIQPYLTQAQKILDSLPTNALGRWPSKVRVIHRSPLLRLPEIPEAILDTVTRGLLDGRRLDVEYRSREKGESTRCLLNPLGLVVKGGIAYLVCTLWDYTDIRQVVLHRVQHAEVLDASVIVPTGFDLDLYIQEGEFAYPVGEPMRLEAVFSHGADFHLHDTPLSADQVLTELDHERVLLRATVENTAELRWWLLGFGELVEVLAPADLREEFRA
jgi:predicted DNA-binding transcriptional regulator YafY